MANLKAVLQGNSCGTTCCAAMLQGICTYALNHDNDGFSCIDDLHWEVSLDICCMCTLASIAIYVRSKFRWLLPKAFVWCRFTCDPYKPWSADPVRVGTSNLAGWCSTDLLTANMVQCQQACYILWPNDITNFEHSKPVSDCSALYAAGCMIWDKCRHYSLLQIACVKALKYIYSMQLLLQQPISHRYR